MNGLRAKGMLVMLCGLATAGAHAAQPPVHRAAYTLQADAQGEGSATVVFESGFGQGGGVWKDVIAGLGADCRCITYARSRLGRSGGDGKPKTIGAHVADLAAVIDTLAASRKVVLVGHSYGGLLAIEYARLQPERLQARVLVDRATLGQRSDFLKADRKRVRPDDKTMLGMLPPATAADYRLLIDQLDRVGVAAPAAMPDVPVALLTSTHVSAEPFVPGETALAKSLWKEHHAALFARFPHGTHRYVDTGHNIHREDPRAVVEAIRFVMTTRDASH